MDESCFNFINKAIKHYSVLAKVLFDIYESRQAKIQFDLYGHPYTYDLYDQNDTYDYLQLIWKLDCFKKDNPDNYEKYLNIFFMEFDEIWESFNDLNTRVWEPLFANGIMNTFDINLGNKAYTGLDCISATKRHIIELIIPEIETQEQPKPITQPKGKTQLNRNQTGLLFWYLREKSLIAPKAENQNIAKAIELMTGHSAKVMADILKKPQTEVCKLGKEKPVNKNDFDIVIAELEALIRSIKKDKLTNLENGELN